MRITIDVTCTEELEQLAAEACTSARPARIKLGYELQAGIIASYRRNGVPGHSIVGKPECSRCDAPVTGGCREADCPMAHRHAELPADRELLRRVHGRPFYTLTDSDVGKMHVRAFGRNVPVHHFTDHIGPVHVGRRVYDVDGIVQVETEEQRGARLKAAAAGEVR